MARTLVRALLTTTIATGAAYVAFRYFTGEAPEGPARGRAKPATDTTEVDADALPVDVRDRLVSELEAHA